MFSFLFRDKTQLVDPHQALEGREQPAFPQPETHHVFGSPLEGPFPEGARTALFAMGCFWGAEKRFWEIEGVLSTQVGYAAGVTRNPTYDEVCSGRTNHAEVVKVTYDPARVSYETLLKSFWEGHDPTQGMQQGHDAGTPYRSGVWALDADELRTAELTRDAYQAELTKKGFPAITTELGAMPDFWPAEGYHQQYLAKNPGGYCGLGGTGVSCPVGLAT